MMPTVRSAAGTSNALTFVVESTNDGKLNTPREGRRLKPSQPTRRISAGVRRRAQSVPRLDAGMGHFAGASGDATSRSTNATAITPRRGERGSRSETIRDGAWQGIFRSVALHAQVLAEVARVALDEAAHGSPHALPKMPMRVRTAASERTAQMARPQGTERLSSALIMLFSDITDAPFIRFVLCQTL